jgi:hypothetical protein
MEGFLAKVNYGHQKPTAMADAMERCPHHCIQDLAEPGEAAPHSPSVEERTS